MEPPAPALVRAPTAARHDLAARAPLALAVGVVLVQIAYPLLDGDALTAATVLAVVLFTAASLAHVGVTAGARTALSVAVTATVIGLAAEAIGVRTGVPFGTYRYTDTLGPQVLGVPLVVPLAWTMMAYPALRLARRVVAGASSGTRGVLVALTGGATLTAWDLYLDPQMVEAGHWVWAFPDPHLPGVPGIPLTNAAGWLLVGTILTAALDRVVPQAPLPPRAHLVPAVLLTWTWAGSALANVAFFDRPWVALYGGVAMGVPVVAYLWSLRRDRVR